MFVGSKSLCGFQFSLCGFHFSLCVGFNSLSVWVSILSLCGFQFSVGFYSLSLGFNSLFVVSITFVGSNSLIMGYKIHILCSVGSDSID